MRFLFLLAITFGSIVCSASGQLPEASPTPSPAAPGQKLHVVTRDLEPFSFERDGRRVGFAMELWDNVAREAKFEYDVSSVNTAKEMIAEVQARKADVGVGALSITAEREKVIDFSQPFYESGLDILTVGGSGGITGTLWMILGNLLNWQLLGGLAAFILAMLIVSHLVWMYEHKVNSDMWPENYRQGMWESFWWSISIFLVGGADNKGPIGLGGRLVAIVWMLMSIVAISLFTASLTTALTVNSLKPAISSYRDLPGVKVATIGGSAAETWLQKNGCVVSTFPKVNDCIEALKAGKVKAVVYDAPILQYAVSKTDDEELLIVDNLFDRNNYGFALQQDSPIRETVNQALLSLSEQGVIDSLKQKWFKSGE